MEDFIEELIQEVKEYPELYNRASKNYMNMKRKQKIWANLDAKFEIDVKKKWTGIRDKYCREKRKKEKASGSEFHQLAHWKYFDSLAFLDDHLKPRKTTDDNTTTFHSECDSLVSNETNDAFDFEQYLSLSQTKMNLSNDNKMNPSTPQTISRSTRSNLSTFQTKLGDEPVKTMEVEDEDSHFIKSIGFMMKKMKQKEKNAFKILMLQEATIAMEKNDCT